MMQHVPTSSRSFRRRQAKRKQKKSENVIITDEKSQCDDHQFSLQWDDFGNKVTGIGLCRKCLIHYKDTDPVEQFCEGVDGMGNEMTELMWATWNQELPTMAKLLLEGHSPFYVGPMGDSAFTFVPIHRPQYLEAFILLMTFAQSHKSYAESAVLYHANEMDYDLMQRALRYKKFDLVYLLQKMRPLTTCEEFCASYFNDHELEDDEKITPKRRDEIMQHKKDEKLKYDVTIEELKRYTKKDFGRDFQPKIKNLTSILKQC